MNRKNNEPTISEMTFANNKVSDPQVIASRLNKHFARVGTKLTVTYRGLQNHLKNNIKCAQATFDRKPTN